jgi:hypothetical protein
MEKKIYPIKQLEIPKLIFERDGPFKEFRSNLSYITVELQDGAKVKGVYLLYPNYVIGVEGCDELPFQPADVVKAYQTTEDVNKRDVTSCKHWYDVKEFS